MCYKFLCGVLKKIKPIVKKTYIKDKKIFETKESNIYLANCRSKKVILKEIKKSRYRKVEYVLGSAFKNEKRLCHINDMVKDYSDDTIAIILPYYKNGDLFEYVVKKGLPISENETKAYIKQMLLCLQDFHKYNYVHLDVKLENFLIGNDGNLILSDFGLSQKFNNEYIFKNLNHRVGTNTYLSPEMYIYKKFNYKTDVWSIGVSTYILLTGNSLYKNIADYNGSFHIDNISNEANDFLKNTLSINKDRMTIDDSLNHPWINDFYEDEVSITI